MSSLSSFRHAVKTSWILSGGQNSSACPSRVSFFVRSGNSGWRPSWKQAIQQTSDASRTFVLSNSEGLEARRLATIWTMRSLFSYARAKSSACSAVSASMARIFTSATVSSLYPSLYPRSNITCVCLYASSLLERTRDISERRSLVKRISMGAIATPGDEETLKELIREVASINSFSCAIFGEGLGTSRLDYSSVKVGKK